MPQDFIEDFRLCLLGRSCTVIRSSKFQWQLDFGQGDIVQSFCTWRIVGTKRIEISDFDDNQLFGFDDPVDAEVRANELLSEAVITSVRIDHVTSDLKLEFSNGMRFEGLNLSSGYEGWLALFFAGRERPEIVVRGGGEVVYLDG